MHKKPRLHKTLVLKAGCRQIGSFLDILLPGVRVRIFKQSEASISTAQRNTARRLCQKLLASQSKIQHRYKHASNFFRICSALVDSLEPSESSARSNFFFCSSRIACKHFSLFSVCTTGSFSTSIPGQKCLLQCSEMSSQASFGQDDGLDPRLDSPP